MTAPIYLAIDLETTGLDPTRDRILELAAVILDTDLQQIGAYSTCVQAPAQALDSMVPFVLDMHLGTGLIQRGEKGALILADVGKPLADVEEYLANVADVFAAKPILLGSSVHFDRGFLRQWMPALESKLHHRHLDASSVKALVPEPAIAWPTPTGVQHRALPDINHSIAILRHARGIMGAATV